MRADVPVGVCWCVLTRRGSITSTAHTVLGNRVSMLAGWEKDTTCVTILAFLAVQALLSMWSERRVFIFAASAFLIL